MDCSKKLDKIDKIFISFTYIIVTLFCIFNTISNASEKDFILIQPTRVLDNLTFNSKDNFLFRFGESQTNVYNVINTEYLVINGNTKNISFCFIKDEPAPYVSIYEYTDVLVNETVEIDLTDKDYKYMLLRNVYGGFNDFEVYVSTNSLSYVIDNLSKNVGITNLWTTFEKNIPFIFVVVIFSLGFWFIKHNIIEHSKGRDF